MLFNKIKNSPLFEGLNADQQEILNGICYQETFEEGTTIFEIGQSPNYLYFVIEGELQLTFPNKKQLSIGPSEFIGEMGLLNGTFRIGELSVVKPTEVVKLCGTSLFVEDLIPPNLALLITRRMGVSVTNYFKSIQNKSSEELIKHGESGNVEFKSSLRWNYKAEKKDKAIEFAVLKTIAAFLNSKGGNLFIGVNDEGNILGLEKDNFANDDKMLLHLTSLIKSKISPNHLQFIHMVIETIAGAKFLRIDCTKGKIPAFVKYNEQELFFIRTGPSTTSLKISDALTYVNKNFAI